MSFHQKCSKDVTLSNNKRTAAPGIWPGSLYSRLPLQQLPGNRFVIRVDKRWVRFIGITGRDPDTVYQVPEFIHHLPRTWCVNPSLGWRWENSKRVDTGHPEIEQKEGDIWGVEATPGGQVYMYHNLTQPWGSPAFTLDTPGSDVWAAITLGWESTISVVDTDTEPHLDKGTVVAVQSLFSKKGMITEVRLEEIHVISIINKALGRPDSPEDLWRLTEIKPPVHLRDSLNHIESIQGDSTSSTRTKTDQHGALNLKLEVLNWIHETEDRDVSSYEIEAYGVKFLKELFADQDSLVPCINQYIERHRSSSSESVPYWLVQGKLEWFCKKIRAVTEGSIITEIEVSTLESLEEILDMYKSNELLKLYNILLVPALKEEFHLIEVELQLSIDQTEYSSLQKCLPSTLEEESKEAVKPAPLGQEVRLSLEPKKTEASVMKKSKVEKTDEKAMGLQMEQNLKKLPLRIEDAKSLRRSTTILEEYLEPEDVVKHLRLQEAIAEFERQDILAEKATWRKNQALCSFISRQSQYTFNMFIDALKKTGQEVLASFLQNGDLQKGMIFSLIDAIFKILEIPHGCFDESSLAKLMISMISTTSVKQSLEEKKKDKIPHRYMLAYNEKRLSEEKKLTMKKMILTKASRGNFYCKLSLASQESKLNLSTEEYCQRTAANLETWEELTIESIFQALPIPDPFLSPRTVLILGIVGIGKTVVTKEIYRRKLAYRFVYRFECRTFRAIIAQGKERSLKNLIFDIHGPPVADTDAEETLDGLNDKNVLIIFDGLDELLGFSSFNSKDHHTVFSPTLPTSIHNLLMNIIDGNLIPEAHILCTSRPNGTVALDKFQRVAVILGFGRKSIEDCMFEICDQDESSHQMIMKHLDETRLYYHCFVPLVCTMLGEILKNDLESTAYMDRFTNIYTELTYQILRLEKEKRPGRMTKKITFDTGKKQSFHKLMKMAAQGMLDRKILFDEDTLEKFNITDIEIDTGILDTVDENGATIASFIHLSYQEFLSAAHNCAAPNTDSLEKIFSEIRKNTSFDIVLQYMAGLLGDRKKGHEFLKNILVSFEEIDFSERGYFLLKRISTMAHESVNEDKKRLILLLLICISEGKFPIEDKLKMAELDLSGFPQGLLPNQLVAVSYYLQNNNSLTCLNLRDSQISSEGINVLGLGLKAADRLKEINLSGNRLDFNSFKQIAASLKSKTTLQKIGFGFTGMTDKSLGELLPIFSRNKCISNLGVGHKISVDGLRQLAETLAKHKHLEVLCVAGPELDPKFIDLYKFFPEKDFNILLCCREKEDKFDWNDNLSSESDE